MPSKRQKMPIQCKPNAKLNAKANAKLNAKANAKKMSKKMSNQMPKTISNQYQTNAKPNGKTHTTYSSAPALSCLQDGVQNFPWSCKILDEDTPGVKF